MHFEIKVKLLLQLWRKTSATYSTPILGGCVPTTYHICKKESSYIARDPVLRTAQSALRFTHWQTCSFQCHFNFSGKHSATLHLLHEDYSFTYPSLCFARYSFIQLSELWQCGVIKLGKGSQWDLRPGSLD